MTTTLITNERTHANEESLFVSRPTISHESPKLAIVIPVHNEERNIGACLTHLLNQSVKPDTVLVVNDGSTDRTVDIIEEKKQNHDGHSIHICHLPRSSGYGIGYSRNSFLGKKWLDRHKISYDLLMVLDADQRPAQDYLELCIDEFDPDTAIVEGVTIGSEIIMGLWVCL